VSKFISPAMAQLLAYGNLLLIILGIFLILQKTETKSKSSQLWFVYYILYYAFALLATGMSGFDTSIIATLIPIIYYIGFYFLLSNEKQLKIFSRVITFSFAASAIVTVIMFKMNFHLSSGEIFSRDLDRAGGLYADANNAALASIIAYVLFDKFINPTKLVFKIIKIVVLITLFYSLFLTFSTTGLFVFTIIFFITNYKFFRGIKLIFLGVAIILMYVIIFSLKSEIKNLDLSDAQTDKIENIVNVLTFNLEEVDNSGRSDLLENVLYYLYENPLIGNGVDFSIVMRGHNTYIGVWVDAGIFTFLFFLFILFYFLIKSFTLKLNLRFFAISILVVLYIFMFSLQSVINQPYLMVLFVFLGYLIDHTKRNNGHYDFLTKTEH
jgi:O-antigen ligase